MPIYEYGCRDCGHEFEKMQKVGARQLRTCPECAGRLEKLVSRTSFQLKGGGWFAHGYSDKPAASGEKKTKKKKSKKAATAKAAKKTGSSSGD